MMSDHHVCVLGAGIVGLSTARSLRKRGYKVTIVSAEHSLSSNVISQGAGGLWEPYNCKPFDLVNKWAYETLNEYLRMLKMNPYNGLVEVVSMIDLHNDANKEIENWYKLNPEFQKFQSLSMQELLSQGQGLSGWTFDEEAIPTPNYCWSEESVPSGWLKYPYAFMSHSVVVNSPSYLQMLLDEFELDPDVSMYMGEEYFFKTLMEATNFASTIGCTSLINCTGLGACELCNDNNMTAGRGGIAMFQRPVVKDKPSHGGIWKSNVVVGVEESPLGSSSKPAYIIPRKDILVVGGNVDVRCVKSKNDEEVEVIGEEELNRLVNNYKELYIFSNPADHQLQNETSVVNTIRSSLVKTWVGLRPLRSCGIRVEADTSGVFHIPVIHNYGHGGSGWTIHHGTSQFACDLLAKALTERTQVLGTLKARL